MAAAPGVTETAVRPTILHIATVGMSTVFLRGQVGYMKECGFEIEVATSPGPDLDRFGEEQSVVVHPVEMPRRITPISDAIAVQKLRRLIRERHPTIVHSHTPKGGLLGMIAGALEGVPVRFYHMRGLPLETATGLRRALLTLTERISCRLAHQVICNSHSMRRVALEEGLCEASKIKVLLGGSGNGVDADERFNPTRLDPNTRAEVRARFGIPEDALLIGFVGRLTRDKGVGELVEAWGRLRDAFPGAHLLMIGPFEDTDPLPAETRQVLEKDPRIHLAGMDWETPPYYAAMDIVCLPTYREGFPNVPLEAAAMGLPVVSTRVAGCVDAVEDGRTGLLVPAGDSEALAGALAVYLNSPGRRDMDGTAGRARVLEQFRQEAIWEALLKEYRECL